MLFVECLIGCVPHVTKNDKVHWPALSLNVQGFHFAFEWGGGHAEIAGTVTPCQFVFNTQRHRIHTAFDHCFFNRNYQNMELQYMHY